MRNPIIIQRNPLLAIVALALALGWARGNASDVMQDKLSSVQWSIMEAYDAIRMKKPVADIEKSLAEAQRKYDLLPASPGEILAGQMDQLKGLMEHGQRDLNDLRKLAQINKDQTIRAWLQSLAEGKTEAKQLAIIAVLTQTDRATRYELTGGKIRSVHSRKNSEWIDPVIDPRLTKDMLTKIARLACETRFVKIASGVKDVPKDEDIPAKPNDNTFRFSVILPGVAVFESATYSYAEAKDKRSDMYALMQAILAAAETKPDE